MLDRIAASLSSLAPAEQRVGRLVLHELAARAQVSKPIKPLPTLIYSQIGLEPADIQRL